jgi:hypothetical protein
MAFFNNLSKLDGCRGQGPGAIREAAIPRKPSLLSVSAVRRFGRVERKMPPLQAEPSRRDFGDEPRGRSLPLLDFQRVAGEAEGA